jgi:hypothetical protein
LLIFPAPIKSQNDHTAFTFIYAVTSLIFPAAIKSQNDHTAFTAITAVYTLGTAAGELMAWGHGMW